MKNFTKIFCVALILGLSCVNALADNITIHFIDKGVEVWKNSVPMENNVSHPIAYVISTAVEDSLKDANRLQNLPGGYEFAGWKTDLPKNHEREYGKLTMNDLANDDEHILTQITIGSSDITLFAVYRREVDCYRKITQSNLEEGKSYLIVGKYNNKYYAMGNTNVKVDDQPGANSTQVENHAITRDGIFHFGVTNEGTTATTGTVDKIYEHVTTPYDQYVWKLSRENSTNWYWNNQGNTSSWLSFDVNYTLDFGFVSSYKFDGYDDIIGSRTGFNMSSDNLGNFTIGRDRQMTGLLLLVFIPIVTTVNHEMRLWFYGTDEKFLLGDESDNNDVRTDTKYKQGDIFLYKQAKEYHFVCHSEPYTVHFAACGSGACTGFSVNPIPATQVAYVDETNTPWTSANLNEPWKLRRFAGVAEPTVTMDCPEGWEVLGWVEDTPLEKTTNDPSDLFVTFPYNPIFDNKTLYAVYGHKGATAGTYDYYTSYPTCEPYTVYFDPIDCAMDWSGITTPESHGVKDEANATITQYVYGANIKMPNATFSGTCSNVWSFAGWTTSICDGVTAAPSPLLTAGSMYKPISEDERFYAVFKKGEYWTSYPTCEKATVILDPGTGSVTATGWASTDPDNPTETKKQQTEVDIVSGITLPTANHGCSVWTLAGWSESPVTDETTDVPANLITAGTLYHPKSNNVTLYAVFVRGGVVYHSDPDPLCPGATVTLYACAAEDDCGDTYMYTEKVEGETVIRYAKDIKEDGAGAGVDFVAPIIGCARWEFAGWKAGSPYTNNYIRPTGLLSATEHYVPSQDESFYAVYKHTHRDYWTSIPDCSNYNVTLYACEGTVLPGSASTDTETDVAGAGFILPECAPQCTDRGWKFHGWIEGGELSTTKTAPTVYRAGSPYYPLPGTNHVLYAVYSIERYDVVTSAEQLNAGSNYALVFHFNFGDNAKFPHEWFEMGNINYEYDYNGDGYEENNLLLSGVETYVDEYGTRYIRKPDNDYVWTLYGSEGRWAFLNFKNNQYQYLYVPYYYYYSLQTSSDYYTQFTIDVNSHIIRTLSDDYDYPYLHFTRNDAESKYYAHVNNTHDECYLFKESGTYYASWAHCLPYTVILDGCDGDPDFTSLTTEEKTKYSVDTTMLTMMEEGDDGTGKSGAGKGIVLPKAKGVCDGWIFAGWTEEQILTNTATSALTKPIYPAGSVYIPNRDNTTLYAVYYQPTKDGDKYVYNRVTSLADLRTGVNSLIVYDKNAMNNTITPSQDNNYTTDVNQTLVEQVLKYQRGRNKYYKYYYIQNRKKNLRSNLGKTGVTIINNTTIKSNDEDITWQFVTKGDKYVVWNNGVNKYLLFNHNGSYLDHQDANWTLYEGNQNVNQSNERYRKYYYYHVYQNYVSLSADAVCEVSLTESNDNFKFRTSYMRTATYLRYQENAFKSNSTYYDNQNAFSIYQQQATFNSYPCSKLVEAARWESGAAIVESLKFAGKPGASSKTIVSIAPTHSPQTDGEADDGTYRIKHNANPGSRIRFNWGGSYYSLKVPYVATDNYKPNVENFPYQFLVITEGEYLINKNTILNKVCVYGGAKLTILPGFTLTVDTLVLRNSNDAEAPAISFGDATSHIKINSGIIYHDLRIPDDRYYTFSVPFDCTLGDVRYGGLISNEAIPVPELDATHNNTYWLKFYNGEQRALDAASGNLQRTYWQHVCEDGASKATRDAYVAKAGKGYIIGLADNKVGNHHKRTLRFKMNVGTGTEWNNYENGALDEGEPYTKEVEVVPSTAENKINAGWNFIGNPYLHTYYPGSVGPESGLLAGYWTETSPGKYQLDGVEAGVPYLTVYNPDEEIYQQVRADQAGAAIKPFLPVFVQVETQNRLKFTEPMTSRSQQAPAIIRRNAQTPTARTGILLYEPSTYEFDQTGLVISDKYSHEYEIGGDLLKMKNSGRLNVYSMLDANTGLAFNAINEAQAENNVPIGVDIPRAGKYTFMFDQFSYDPTHIRQLLLTDFELGKTVDLLMRDYEFTIRKGTNNTRFAVAVVLNEDENTATPTSVYDTDREDAYCYTTTEGLTVTNIKEATDIRIFDLLGKQIHSAEGVTGKQHFSLPQGVYNIVLTTGNEQTTLRGIVR